MPYESKPMKKQWIEVDGKMTPIILPQIWSHEKQDWVITSEENPLPTQVTGSNVEVIPIVEGLSIADTEEHSFFVDVSKFKEKGLYVVNLINGTNITITIRSLSPISDNRISTVGSITIPRQSKHITQLDDGMEALSLPIYRMRVDVKASDMPTSGAISISLIGGTR